MTITEIIAGGAATFGFSLLLAFLVDIRSKLSRVCIAVAALKRGDEDREKEIAEIKATCIRNHNGSGNTRKYPKGIRDSASVRL